MSNILLLEDSPDCQLLVTRALSELGNISLATTVKEAMDSIKRGDHFDLAIIDINLPDGSGLEFCTHLTSLEKSVRPRILFVTGSTDIAKKLMGFSLGCDDYVVKPFDPLELKARVQVMLRNMKQNGDAQETVAVGNLRLFPSSLKVELVENEGPRTIEFTLTEFKLLYCLAKQEGQIFSRDQLLYKLSEGKHHVLDRTIDSHLSRTRKKLVGCTHTVEAIYGMGYRFAKVAA